MDAFGSESPNLLAQIEKSFGDISSWTWFELLITLKQFQELLPSINSSFILQRVLDCIVAKLVLSSVTSPYASSLENSSFKFSCDTKMSESWWFEDLLFLNTNITEKVIRAMVSQEFDNAKVSKFLFYYQKLKIIGASSTEKCKITEVVIRLLYLLDRSSLCFKGLFNIYQVALRVKARKRYINKLESLMGSQLDQANINYLVFPSPLKCKYIYDVNMVLRFVRAFLLKGVSHLQRSRLYKVGQLIDVYLIEVAPDSHLRPSKFSELASLLPDCARESHDRLYKAMDIYFEVHVDLSEEDKIIVCGSLKYEKLSAKSLKHLARNTKFPVKASVKAFIARDSKVRSLVQKMYHLKSLSDPFFCKTAQDTLDGPTGRADI